MYAASAPNRARWPLAARTHARRLACVRSWTAHDACPRRVRVRPAQAFSTAFDDPAIYAGASLEASPEAAAALRKAIDVMVRAARARLSVEMKSKRKVNYPPAYRAERNQRDNTYSLQWA
eukprot:3023284-Prymnesium_polylepis.1